MRSHESAVFKNIQHTSGSAIVSTLNTVYREPYIEIMVHFAVPYGHRGVKECIFPS